MIAKAYKELFSTTIPYEHVLKYSAQFSPYNANIRKRGNAIEIRMSIAWKDVSEEIQIGCMQHLMSKMWKTKTSTLSMDLYKDFLKRIRGYAQVTEKDSVLEASFHRVNEKYFYGRLDVPNLRWGQKSVRQLGLYEYQSDRITISSILKGQGEVLDFIMYHELLHKDEGFEDRGGRCHYHTPAFKKRERMFERYEEVQKEIKRILTARRGKNW